MLSSRFILWSVSLSLLATLGCSGRSHGGDTAEPPSSSAIQFAVSGARLQAWFLEADASRIFDSFHDRELDTDCIFQPTAGDSYVCFPSAPADVVYLDAACRQPALRFDSTGVEALPSWVTSTTAAPASQRVGYQVAELVYTGGLHAEPEPPAVFAKSEGGCEPTRLELGLLPASLYRLAPRTEDVFAAASAAPLRLSDDFSLQRLRAQDGAELTLGVLNADDAACEPQLDGVCVPLPFSVLRVAPGPGLFLDAGCSEPAFAPSAEALASVLRFGVDRASGATRVFELKSTNAFAKLQALDPVTGAGLHGANGHWTYSCQPDQRFAAWAPGGDRTSDFAVAAQSTANVGTLRWVQQRAPGAATDELIPFEAGGAFVDEQGVACRVRATADHLPDCYTDGPEVLEIGAFSDSACSDRLYDLVGASDDEATSNIIPRLRRVDGRGSDTLTLRSFKPYAGPTYRSSPGHCELYEPTTLRLQTDRIATLPTFTRVRR